LPANGWPLVAIVVALGPWVNGCHFHITYGTSRYPGTATYVVQRPGTGWQDAVATEVRLVDCDDGPTIEIGDACRLRGSWAEDDLQGIGGEAGTLAWHMGTVVIASGQSCTLPLSAGPTAMTLSTGVTHVRGARVVEVSLAGVVKGGPDAGHAATFSFTAPPAGPLVPSTCARSSPQDTTRQSTAGGS